MTAAVTTDQQSPAVRIIKRFGGLTKAARAWGKPKTTVQRWQASGYIHPDYYPEILDAAVTTGTALDPADFNLVDVSHPAFNAPSNPSSDNTADRGAGSYPGPKLSTGQSLAPNQGAGQAGEVLGDVELQFSSDPLSTAPRGAKGLS